MVASVGVGKGFRPIRNTFKLPSFLARQQHTVSGRITPSGRFSLGSTPKNPPPSAKRVDEAIANYEVSDLRSEEFRCDLYGHRPACLLSDAPEGVVRVEGEGHQTGTPFGSSKPDISHNRGKRGVNGISAKASAQLTYWLSQFEMAVGRANLSFLTLTCPEVKPEDRCSIQDNWSEIVRRFIQELKRELRRRGAVRDTVLGCSEIQEERARKYGWDVPHLHLVFQGRGKASRNWLLRPEEVRGLWQRILCSYLSDSDIDFRATENIQRVRFSCARYLGKYLSKSSSKCRATVEASQWFPSDYTVIPARLRTWYRTHTVSGYSVALYVIEVLKNHEKINGLWMKPITIQTSIGEQIIGWVGNNPEWVMNAPRDIWEECCG